MSNERSLDELIDDTGAQLVAALDEVIAGSLVDLTDLVPRLERICAMAVEQRAIAAAPRLAQLIAQLDALERMLRERIAALASEAPADPRRAAAQYRAAAAPPADAEK